MEDLGIDPSFWRRRRVFVTGHSGFKGSWLSLWLQRLGASVSGLSLPPDTSPNLFELARVSDGMNSGFGDIRDSEVTRRAIEIAKPEIVFHMAAQPLVRASYDQPLTTFATNVMGTAHVLEAVRQCSSIRVAQVVTTDKVYRNRESIWPYREDDPLGGHDPYSASKAATEMVVSSYRQSFLEAAGVSVASVRAGNVIGGGDWAKDRLLPDCIRAFRDSLPVVLRRPDAVRPWQHVLEPLAGYLLLAQKQWQDCDGKARHRYSRSFNFGPDFSGEATVGAVANMAAAAWGNGAQLDVQSDPEAPHEAGLLTLDPTLVRHMLGWRTRLAINQAVDLAVGWYRRWYSGQDARALCLEQIGNFAEIQQ